MTDKPKVDWIKYRELEPIYMDTVPCKYCGTELAPDHPAVTAQIIENGIDWEPFESEDDRWGHPVNSTMLISGLTERVKVVAKKFKPAIDELEEGYYEGGSSYPQGTTFPVYVVLQYGETYFKKTGTADSYGNVVWDGVLKETKPKKVIVSTWE